MIAAASLRSSARASLLLASAMFSACMRAPDASPSVLARAQQPSRVEAPSAERAPAHEQKPSAGAQVDVRVAPTQSDVASVTVTVTATRALRDAKLRIGTELPTRVEGDAEWTLEPMNAGQSITRTVNVRRTQPSAFGSLVTASVTVEQSGSRVSDVGAAWAFGEPSPERVLPRSGAALGEDGVGQLGPNDRVIRTPEGVRLHESTVP
ncbi:MAG: hypothetical protein U0269_02850 [Polyangiales bacterium]